MNISKTILSGCVSVALIGVYNLGYYKGAEDIAEELRPRIEALEVSNTELLFENHDMGNDLIDFQRMLQLKDSQLATPVKVSASKLKFKQGTKVGKFVISAYSPYDDRNYINSDGNPNDTSTGTTPKPGTMAVDPSVIPYGSKITIIYPDGTIEHGRAEDTGGAIKRNRIDVFRYSFDTAMDFGKQEAIVIWK